jgi:hypothetical protein
MADLRISDEDWDAPLEEEDIFKLPNSSAYSNLNAASQGNPETYAQDLELSNRTGVPVSAVKANRDEIAKQDATALIKQEDWDKPLSELDNPAVAKYLEDPDAAQISYDDLSNLTGLENEAGRSWYEVNERMFEGLGDSMMIGMGKTYDETAILMLNEMKREGFTSWKDAFGSIPSVMGKMRDQIHMAMEGEEDTDAWNAELERRIEGHKQNLGFAESEIGRLTPADLTTMEQGVRQGFQMGADMAPGLAISVATRGKINPTLGYLTGKTYLSSYGSAILGGKDHDTATTYATIDAALEYATEKLPTKRLEKLIGEAGGGGGIKSSIKKWLLQEAGTEQIATATQTINAYAFELDEELAAAQGWEEILDIQGQRQAVTLIGTIVGGGGMAATIKGVDYAANRERRAMGKVIKKINKRRGAEFEQERLDSLLYLAQASKTNQRSADEFEKFMEGAAPDQKVFLSSEGVDLLDNPPAYIIDQMDGSGGDVSIPLSTFLKDFANDEAKLALIRPHIKTSEGLLNQTELEEDSDSEYIKTLLAKANEAAETKNAADEIYERITSQLVATGQQSAATARQSATLIPALVTTKYEELKREGKTKPDGSEWTLEDVFADFNLEIVGPEVDVAGEFMQQEAAFEDGQAEAPAPGQPFLAMRIGSGGELTNTNAGNAQAVAAHIARQEDDMGPSQLRFGDTVTVYNVTAQDEFGGYQAITGRKGAEGATQVGRAKGMTKTAGTQSVNYSFPEGANYQATEAMQIPYADIVARLNEKGYENMDDAGSRIGGQVIEELVAERMVSAAPRVLSQQNLSNIELVEDRIDPAGNVLTITQNAGMLWKDQQARSRNIDKLRSCLRA